MGLLDRWTKKKTEQRLKSDAAAEVKPAKPASPSATPKERRGAKSEARQAEKISAPVKGAVGGVAFRVLIHPVATEKSAAQESANKYTFVVAKFASKFQIKQAIKEVYGVEPININVINVDGRRVRFGRSLGRRSDYRKAVITLPAGKSISLHEGV